MRIRSTVIALTALLATLPAGCPSDSQFEDAAPAHLSGVTAIVDDTSLTPQQKRAALAGLGLDENVINAVMITIRLGNQFGGDARTAYDKVTGGRLDAMTPDEVQVYSDEASRVGDLNNFSLTDAEGQRAVLFFQDFGITTRDELANYLSGTLNVQPNGLPDEFLSTIFVDFDPALLVPELP
ncbi:MAG: hypothetical protein CHACPFDD_02827 [Phycisphaerae bacterium]|nr:hypothetical protein [Phycisphaerae bacterium]